MTKPLPEFALHQQEAAKRRHRQRNADGDRPDHQFIAAHRDQQNKADDREDELARRLHQHIDDHARGGERAADAAQRETPRADEIAADLGERQQRIGAFADKPQSDAEPDRGPLLARKQQPPAAAGNGHRDDPRDHHGSMAAQPALTMAAPTWSAPYQSVSPISTDMPTNQTISVACLPDGIYSLKEFFWRIASAD